MLDIHRSDLVAGVAGSGTMGLGIAQVLAQCGVRTLVFDSKPGAAQAAKDAIGKSLAMGDAMGGAKILAILEAMHAFYEEPRYRPSPWLKRRARLKVSLLTQES